MIETKKNAIELLERNPENLDYKLRLRSIVDGALPEYYLASLEIRRGYSDYTSPGTLVDEHHPDYPFMKCKGNIIKTTISKLESFVDDFSIKGDNISRRVKDFKEHRWEFSKGKKGEYWTTPEEIRLINDTLDDCIEYIKRMYRLDQEKVESIKETITDWYNKEKIRCRSHIKNE